MLRPSKKWRKRSNPEELSQMEGNVIDVDKECRLSDLDIAVVEQLHMDADKHGYTPHILIEELEITQFRTIGHENQHLKLIVRQDSDQLECIGHGLGHLAKLMSLNSFVNVVGEPVVHEWNGFRKIQLHVVDLSIPHMQIFDFRETKDKLNKLVQFFDKESVILCFRKESIIELERERYHPFLYMGEGNGPIIPPDIAESVSFLFLYDMPYSLEDISAALVLLPCPERIYCLFGNEYIDRLATLPGRDQFKWLYAVLLKNSYLNREFIPKLSKSRGISENTIEFMIEVFEDLDFVIPVEGGVKLNPTPAKRNITESGRYLRKKNEMLLETEILYSSYGILCKTLKEVRINT